MIHRRASACVSVLAGVVVLACASPPPPRPASAAAAPQPVAAPGTPRAAPRAESGGLTFVVEPADAEVFVDGRSHGKVADLVRGGVLLPPGLYQVSLERAGYETWRVEVSVRAAIEPIRVTLTRAAGAR